MKRGCSGLLHLTITLSLPLVKQYSSPRKQPIRRRTIQFWTSGPVRGESPDYWDSAELIHAPIPRNGSGKTTTTTHNT